MCYPPKVCCEWFFSIFFYINYIVHKFFVDKRLHKQCLSHRMLKNEKPFLQSKKEETLIAHEGPRKYSKATESSHVRIPIDEKELVFRFRAKLGVNAKLQCHFFKNINKFWCRVMCIVYLLCVLYLCRIARQREIFFKFCVSLLKKLSSEPFIEDCMSTNMT